MSKAEDIARKKELALEYYEAMPIYKYAAAFAGVHEDTMALWRKDDAEFSDNLQKAKAEFIRRHGNKAKHEFLLERLDKENFSEKITHEVEGGLFSNNELTITVVDGTQVGKPEAS